MHVLLIHLIKQAAEQRTTPLWDRTIRNALFWIPRINRRRKAGGWYLPADDLQEALADVYAHALDSVRQKRWVGPTLQRALASW
jgi:hypothetical protein